MPTLMDTWYYDIQPEFLHIERVYCFKWDEFSDQDREELSQVYEVLPGWRGKYRKPPSWFGLKEWKDQTYIQATVEPSGLMVRGKLIETDWLSWDVEFRKWAESLPIYQMPIWYYDAEPRQIVDFERMYCFDWFTNWTDEHDTVLAELYPTLPGWGGYEYGPWWFGNPPRWIEGKNFSGQYLAAAEEPPGLQVFGTLNRADWTLWHREFVKGAKSLPTYTLR